MKKSLLKFLPLMAAVLLATSCKKDDDNNAPANGRDGEHTVSTSTIPFSIKVNTGNSLKKVCYIKSTDENTKGYYNVSFDKDDYAAELKMVIKQGDQEIGALSLEKDLVTFSGDLRVFPEEGAELTAVVTTLGKEGSEAFSDESLEDLFKTCAHTYEGKFIFKYADKDANVTLTDQNVYLAIAMSPCCDHKITINNENFTVQAGTVQAGRIWIAVPAKDGVKSVGLGKEINETEPNPGEIHNVIRQYFTVSSKKKVYFSKGNLQYNPATNEWRFAEHQYDCCVTVNGDITDGNITAWYNTVTKYNGWIDLFGWGMWLDGDDNDPLRIATDGKYYSDITSSSNKYQSLPDNPVIGSEWTTLTAGQPKSNQEWDYLLKNVKFGGGQITIEGGVKVNGIILLPDDFPEGITFKSCAQNAVRFTDNQYDVDAWKIMEANGAVFMPAAGRAVPSSDGKVGLVGFNGDCRYWTSTADQNDKTSAYIIYAYEPRFYQGNLDRCNGLSVRLVRPL